jgi:hypothetical protein
MADALLPGVRCDVDGRRHPLACLGCRELNYGQHSTLPLHRFRLSMPETALAGYRPPRARHWGDVEAAGNRAYFTINEVQQVSFADGQAVFAGRGYHGVYVIWLTHGYGRK